MTRRLLLVDDEPHLLRTVAMTLRAEGYEVTTARNGKEAVVRLAESIPDLVISDIRMPGMDGYGLVRHMRSSPRTDLIPIIFLTAKDTVADRITGFRSEVDAYITKPFEPEELLAIINSIINRVQRTQTTIARRADSLPDSTSDSTGEINLIDEELTEAEARVAELVARGLSNKEVAATLDISVRTVETHVRHILAKKNWSNRVEIARHVFARGQSN